jgi:hypothetical protein
MANHSHKIKEEHVEDHIDVHATPTTIHKPRCSKFIIQWSLESSYEHFLSKHPREKYRVKKVHKQDNNCIIMFNSKRYIDKVQTMLQPYSNSCLPCATDLRKVPKQVLSTELCTFEIIQKRLKI